MYNKVACLGTAEQLDSGLDLLGRYFFRAPKGEATTWVLEQLLHDSWRDGWKAASQKPPDARSATNSCRFGAQTHQLQWLLRSNSYAAALIFCNRND